MRFFFRSRQFKMIVAVAVALIVVSGICAAIGGVMTPGTDLMSSISAPFRLGITKLSGAVSDFVSAYRDGEKLLIENAELENELNEMREKLSEYDRMKEENEFYKNYLEIKDQHSDFQFCAATLISKDADDPFVGFAINKGRLSGVSAYDPVITEAGLVGYISEVGLTTSKVTTLLSSELTVGALDNRTNDSGVIRGSLELAAKGRTRLLNLSRSCNVAVGDYVVTSGEGVFPGGILVGSVISIGNDRYNTSIYADIEPFVKFDAVKDVMVITEFEGQGGLDPERAE